jgi:hypothetical protein
LEEKKKMYYIAYAGFGVDYHDTAMLADAEASQVKTRLVRGSRSGVLDEWRESTLLWKRH